MGLKLVSVPEKSKKSSLSTIAGFFALAVLISGCATLPADDPIEEVDYRACLVTDGDPMRPGLADTAVYALNQAVVTFGVKKEIAASNPSKFAGTTEKLIDGGCNFIAVVGSRFTDQLVEVVSASPAVNYLFITDSEASEVLKADLPNLAVYTVDVYEAGLLAGHIAASFSENRQLAVVCGKSVNANYFRGIRDGVAAFDRESETVTSVNVENSMVVMSDVLLPYGCRDQLNSGSTAYRLPFKVVGFGRDLFFDKELELLQPKVAATVVPQTGERLLEAIAADLESEFIGGILGSTTATYGNRGLVISEEHAIVTPAGERERLNELAVAYELTLK